MVDLEGHHPQADQDAGVRAGAGRAVEIAFGEAVTGELVDRCDLWGLGYPIHRAGGQHGKDLEEEGRSFGHGAQCKCGAGEAGEVINPFVLADGGGTVLRTVIVKITPYFTYLPAINKPCPVYYADYFTDPNSGWFTGNSSNYLVQYLVGEYQMLLKTPGYYLISRAPVGPLPDDFEVSVDVRNVTGVWGSYGLMFAATEDWSNFYTFEIMPDRSWYLWVYSNGTWNEMAYFYSDAIRIDGQSNTLTVRRQSSLISMYINNTQVHWYYDSNNYDSNFMGVTAQSFDAVPLDVRFSNFFMPEFSCIAQTPDLMTAQSPAGGAPGGVFQGPANRPLP